MSSGKALDELQRINLRQRRAEGLAIEIERRIEKASPYIRYEASHGARRAISNAIRDVLMEVGADLITDHDRSEAGLPPRGPDGWTVQELHAIERRRLEALYAPFVIRKIDSLPLDFSEIENDGPVSPNSIPIDDKKGG
jgi:hypothetical protein